jgi:hypothetical protein
VHRQVAITLTNRWAERTEKLGARLWPTENLTIAEIGRRLLLEHVLWVESKSGLVEDTRDGTVGSNVKGHPFETRFGIRLARPDSEFRPAR